MTENSHTNLVLGPHGFTESFDDRTVETMKRLGLVYKDKVVPAVGYPDTIIYKATGLPTHKDYE